jgi:hypothetical protein
MLIIDLGKDRHQEHFQCAASGSRRGSTGCLIERMSRQPRSRNARSGSGRDSTVVQTVGGRPQGSACGWVVQRRVAAERGRGQCTAAAQHYQCCIASPPGREFLGNGIEDMLLPPAESPIGSICCGPAMSPSRTWLA